MKLEKDVTLNTYGLSLICFNENFTQDEIKELQQMCHKKLKLTLEAEKPILDEAERKYLSGFIKPFRDEIEYIRKVPNEYYKTEHLVIYFKDNMNMPFPYFKKGSMYKGMKVDKNYTLKGLGL